MSSSLLLLPVLLICQCQGPKYRNASMTVIDIFLLRSNHRLSPVAQVWLGYVSTNTVLNHFC